MTRRFPALLVDDLTPEQRQVIEDILTGPRGGGRLSSSLETLGTGKVPLGPFEALLVSPDLADKTQRVGEYLRYRSSLPSTVREMAILLTARHWSAPFEWHAHLSLALSAGLQAETAAAIAAHNRPPTLTADQVAVYDFVTELTTTGAVGDDPFNRIEGRYGVRGAIDLVATVGYYTLVAFVLNVDRYPLPAGHGSPFPDWS